jgi:hypothetical protein
MTKLTDIFEKTECSRCGGSGRYSYNQRDGDRCWGCSGSGLMWTREDAPLVAEFNAAAKAIRETTLSKLAIGEEALLGERYIEDGRNMRRWVTVERVEVFEHRFGTDLEYSQTGARVWLSDGQLIDSISDYIVRRKHKGIRDERILAQLSPACRAKIDAAAGRAESQA